MDAAGNVQADADVMVNFSVAGQGELAAVGTGDPADVSSFSTGQKMTYRGQVVAILRPVKTLLRRSIISLLENTDGVHRPP